MVLTPFNQAAIDDPELREKQVQSIPWKRAAEPWELAELAVYLASEAADYASGQTFTLDGRLSMNTAPHALKRSPEVDGSRQEVEQTMLIESFPDASEDRDICEQGHVAGSHRHKEMSRLRRRFATGAKDYPSRFQPTVAGSTEAG